MKIFKTDPSREGMERESLLSEVVAGIRCRSQFVVRYERLSLIAVPPDHTGSLPLVVCYAIEEFVEGECPSYENLARCDEDERWKVFACLARGLRDIHEAGLVHRDLKASNARFRAGIAKWLDFGQVGIFGYRAASPRQNPRPGTRPLNVPFEAWQHGEVVYELWESPGDVFSFGAIVYKLLTDRSPWDREDPSRLDATWEEALKDAEAPGILKRLVREMMAERPGDRLTMAEVVEEMDQSGVFVLS